MFFVTAVICAIEIGLSCYTHSDPTIVAALFILSASCSAFIRERSTSARIASPLASASSACSSALSNLIRSSSVPSLTVWRRQALSQATVRRSRWRPLA